MLFGGLKGKNLLPRSLSIKKKVAVVLISTISLNTVLVLSKGQLTPADVITDGIREEEKLSFTLRLSLDFYI